MQRRGVKSSFVPGCATRSANVSGQCEGVRPSVGAVATTPEVSIDVGVVVEVVVIVVVVRFDEASVVEEWAVVLDVVEIAPTSV